MIVVTCAEYESLTRLLHTASTSQSGCCYTYSVRVTTTVVTEAKYESEDRLLHNLGTNQGQVVT